MRGTRCKTEQIIAILKEAKAGVKTAELCRKYGDITVSEAKRSKQLEEENSKLKHIVADQTLEIKALKYVVSKNFRSPKRNGRRQIISLSVLD